MPPKHASKSSAALDLEGLSIGETPSSTDTTTAPNDIIEISETLPKDGEKKSTRTSPRLHEKEPYTVSMETAKDDEEQPTNPTLTTSPEGTSEEPKAEIQSIIDQFGDEQGQFSPPTSPNRELPVFHYPLRSSSLDHGVLSATDSAALTSPTLPSRDPDGASLHYAPSIRSQPPPPEPDPEPDLPFDFHRFLEQLRHRTADPVAKFLRSFLQEFAKKQWQAHEQVKIIGDFLTFIGNRMAQCEVWRTVSDAEFDNAKEGMEKLVMNRLYGQTFSPEIPAGEPSPMKGRRRAAAQPLGPGRKGQHQEDIERDEVLAQKIRIYGWIREEHLDIQPCNDKGRRFLILAQQELAKIKSYRAPRDKVICVLNTCKVIMGYLRNAESDQSADSFIPLLIYTVLKAKPDHLVSNVQYIQRFRNPDRLNGEAGYYMSSLIGAVQFIENLDRTNLTVSEAEFDEHVEAAVSEIARQQQAQEAERKKRLQSKSSSSTTTRTGSPSGPSMEKPLPRRPDSSFDDEKSAARSSEASSRFTDGSSENESIVPVAAQPAVAGLLRSIQRPLTTIGRIFSDDSSTPTLNSNHNSRSVEYDQASLLSSSLPPTRTARSPARNSSLPQGRRPRSSDDRPPPLPRHTDTRQEMLVDDDTTEMNNDNAAMEANANEAEAYRMMNAEHDTVVETLSGMFPDLDRDIISDVVRMKDGNVGLAVDACLSLSR